MSAQSQPTHLVAYKETREGLYGPYEVEVQERAPEVSWQKGSGGGGHGSGRARKVEQPAAFEVWV